MSSRMWSPVFVGGVIMASAVLLAFPRQGVVRSSQSDVLGAAVMAEVTVDAPSEGIEAVTNAGSRSASEDPEVVSNGTGWVATGLCSPRTVSPAAIRMLFDPNIPGDVSSGTGPLTVQETADGVIFGQYRVTLDLATQSVEVTGPAGADTLRRDILRCTGPIRGSETYDSAGIWKQVGDEWEYVDEPLDAPSIGETP